MWQSSPDSWTQPDGDDRPVVILWCRVHAEQRGAARSIFPPLEA